MGNENNQSIVQQSRIYGSHETIIEISVIVKIFIFFGEQAEWIDIVLRIISLLDYSVDHQEQQTSVFRYDVVKF